MLLLKDKTIFCLYGKVLFASPVSLQEDRAFHHKVLDKLYRNSKLNCLVKFNLISSTLRKP